MSVVLIGVLVSWVLLHLLLGQNQDILVVGPADPTVVGPAELLEVGPTEEVIVEPAVVAVIEPPPRGAWEEKGWEKNGKEWTGVFEATHPKTGRRRRFQGRVAMEGAVAQPYICDPPPEIKKHPEGPCFHLWKGGPWFKVNWSVPATNVDDAILYVERILYESFQR